LRPLSSQARAAVADSCLPMTLLWSC